MKKYGELTNYISILETDDLGRWVPVQGKGTMTESTQLPFVTYSEAVHQFIKDFYLFEEAKAFYLHQYNQLLDSQGIKVNSEFLTAERIETFDDETVMAVIMGIIRNDRFAEGMLRHFLKNGVIGLLLKRLAALDEE
ncbi:DUF6508 domain-containing protein [Lactiplantibacillus songbeiensis]|uniref:DUF6508 domain-containing protein n=1 Tax=Lactiplantibacillus songbeiensis TaxID=2559920 RepID=A0ABW4C220_9LACO|nr:DUF6508 domain-containing protein [Lactiplantibacillus songbeiensis]